MATIIVKKKNGEKIDGAAIAKASRFREEREDNMLYPTDDFYGPQVFFSPVDKVAYLVAELNTMAEKARDGGNEKQAIELFNHIENIEERFAGYVPRCAGFYRHNKWYRLDIPEDKEHLYPEKDYGTIPKQIGIVSDFLNENDVDEFNFVCDSKYVIVLEGRGTNWEAMKASGLIDTDEIEVEYAKQG